MKGYYYKLKNTNIMDLSNKIISPVKDLIGLIADKSLGLYVAIPTMVAPTENYAQGGIRDKLEDLVNNPLFTDAAILTLSTVVASAAFFGGTKQLRKGNKVLAIAGYVGGTISGGITFLYIAGRYL